MTCLAKPMLLLGVLRVVRGGFASLNHRLSLTQIFLRNSFTPVSANVARLYHPTFLWSTSAAENLFNDTTTEESFWSAETDDEIEAGEDPINREIDDEIRDDQLALLEVHSVWSDAVDTAIEELEKKTRSLQSEFEKAQNVEKTMARAQLLVANMYMFSDPSVKSATVHDWENDGAEIELTLDAKYDSASAEADALFAQARKLRRGSQVVEELLSEATTSMETLQECKLDLQSALSLDGVVDEGRLQIVQGRLSRTARQTKFKAPSGESTNDSNSGSKRQNNSRKKSSISSKGTEMQVRRMKSPGGCPVLVGRNRRGNEYLSMTVARGDDIWMHARGCPGAHVLIQVRRGGPKPTDECLEFAANLAAFYSDARNEKKASITAAEPKHILKPRGAPLGAVKLREELYVLVGKPDDVPEECKIARDASGLSDEYRSADKAKHRRRTLEVAKQSQAKKRAQKRATKKRRRTRHSEEDV